VHLANSRAWRAITGEEPPPSPVSAAAYTEHGLPWFALYDERLGDVSASEKLAGVKSMAQLDAERRVVDGENAPVQVGASQVVTLGHPPVQAI
jgi:hypothetical protein